MKKLLIMALIIISSKIYAQYSAPTKGYFIDKKEAGELLSSIISEPINNSFRKEIFLILSEVFSSTGNMDPYFIKLTAINEKSGFPGTYSESRMKEFNYYLILFKDTKWRVPINSINGGYKLSSIDFNKKGVFEIFDFSGWFILISQSNSTGICAVVVSGNAN
ncbi:hypothetical protein [Gracilinema caldarium]|uniref:Uncharacterized protein n=1 Tax=Gracilinema caldarium (strain ATCC 51460 / DSM 7334 / H1) TaxID=744872 RepID=F8F250_GRAC1|nr:hypothetical protein [Gracilinema caldarium]AEJ20322.1 hypothetical protein Spica_2202 [Gracilinema caldarium DSM 7334]